MGKEVRKQIVKESRIDERKSEILREFYRELNFDDKTKLYVIKGREFNAFALPDNSIFIYSEVFNELQSYPQLAALLGHEYSHIKNRHGMKKLGQALSWELLASIFSGDNSDSFIRGANTLLTLENSRAFETEADNDGFLFLEKNFIDLNGMVGLFEIMEKLTRGKEEPPTYLSTHPDTEDRLQAIKDQLKLRKNGFKHNQKLDSLFHELTY